MLSWWFKLCIFLCLLENVIVMFGLVRSVGIKVNYYYYYYYSISIIYIYMKRSLIVGISGRLSYGIFANAIKSLLINEYSTACTKAGIYETKIFFKNKSCKVI